MVVVLPQWTGNGGRRTNMWLFFCSPDGHHLTDETSSACTAFSAETAYTCHVCMKSFSSDTRHHQHESFHFCHPVTPCCHRSRDFRVLVARKKFGCFSCDRKFFTVSARTRHQKQHLFSTDKSGVVHWRRAKPTKKAYVERVAQSLCRECGKVFGYRPCLRMHLRRHRFARNAEKV